MGDSKFKVPVTLNFKVILMELHVIHISTLNHRLLGKLHKEDNGTHLVSQPDPCLISLPPADSIGS